MILLSELKERIETLMRETGKGNRPVYVLDSQGNVHNIVGVANDDTELRFFIRIEFNKEDQ